MKKVILMICLAFAFSQTSNAQIDFGLKGGINYNNNGDATFSSTGSDVIKGGESRSGYHAGLWFRGKLPLIGLYIRPELVFTQVKNEYTDQNDATSEYEYKKLDVPVLLGKKFLGVANVFIGPSFQYIIEDDFSFSGLTTDEFDKFSVGLQMGAGIELGRIGIDVRWERGLSKTEANFANVTVDNRTDQIIFGLSLKL
ncbi:porin family protein [Polaribacter sp. KT 15]|uniref:porin family protein n=1 Tax=Polaribacter sp. KT 15 TaxID=1896175 RepID=UPI00090B073B|nr:porin family protein [Polaribacter sp. KT 15]SHN08722.1 Outer membrane protein beta-barrel domain-containing protein [Polaribacter sp. KT 15]